MSPSPSTTVGGGGGGGGGGRQLAAILLRDLNEMKTQKYVFGFCKHRKFELRSRAK